MPLNKFFLLYLSAILLLTSCIKQFEPDISSSDAKKFVVSGQINKGDSVQVINVSRTSDLKDSYFKPLLGCVVTVFDKQGNSFNAVETRNGNYEVVIPEEKIFVGAAFKVEINTPDGNSLMSDFDELNDCPKIDSLYYEIKITPTKIPYIYIRGLQFYVNLDAENVDCRNFRYEAIETWEYHSAYPIEWYYNGKVVHVNPPDFSRFVCWKTDMIDNVFTLTTRNLTSNAYQMYPLHFVDNKTTPRLNICYSLLLRQYSVSEPAFSYWEKIRINSNTQGGLYEKQPLAIKGNMHNITHPGEEVLGFFGTSTVTSKRIFVKNIPELPLEYYKDCSNGTLLKGGLKSIPTFMYPAYLFGNSFTYELRLIDKPCVDCLLLGGKNVKPDFWPY